MSKEVTTVPVNFEIVNGEWPNVFSCRFLEDGIVYYREHGEDGTIAYLTNETIGKMVQSFIGKPVCIGHQKITPENYEQFRKDGTIVGNVIRVRKDPMDGWWWADFLIDTEAGRSRIRDEKDKVSCAYMIKDTTKGGVWHDLNYDVEITDGDFTHLALVDDPRYEGAIITEQLPAMLVNNKTAHLITHQEGKDMQNVIEFFKKLGDKKEKIDLTVAMNGKEMPLADVLEAIIKNSKEVAPEKIKVGDKEYTVEEIVNGFKSFKEKEAANAKNCNCNAKDGEHGKDCPMYENSKSVKLANAKMKNESDRTDEEKQLIKEEEEAVQAHNAKLKADKEKELANAKAGELEKFFNQLQELANQHPTPAAEETVQGPLMGRAERAEAYSKKIKAQMGKK